jgi:L-glyceraldehyde 3-phosphate reductase
MDEQRAMLRRAFERGVTHFDLSSAYGPPAGAAETNFGQILRQDLAPHRGELILATKGDASRGLAGSLDASLQRLGIDEIDVFYAEGPVAREALDATAAALVAAVRSGKARFVGIASHADPLIPEICAKLRDLGTPVSVVQSSYSILDRQFEDQLEFLAREGVGCIAYSPLADGRLTQRYLSEHPDASDLQALDTLAAGRGQTLSQLAIAWALRDPRITAALIGAGTPAQLDERLDVFARGSLTSEELACVDAALDARGAG